MASAPAPSEPTVEVKNGGALEVDSLTEGSEVQFDGYDAGNEDQEPDPEKLYYLLQNECQDQPDDQVVPQEETTTKEASPTSPHEAVAQDSPMENDDLDKGPQSEESSSRRKRSRSRKRRQSRSCHQRSRRTRRSTSRRNQRHRSRKRRTRSHSSSSCSDMPWKTYFGMCYDFFMMFSMI